MQSSAKPRQALPHLDFDNMPFLKPPSESASHYESFSPSSMHTQWNQGHATWPSIHVKSPNVSMRGEISSDGCISESNTAHSGLSPTGRSPSNSHSGSSITSQLSFLSQMCPAGGPRNHQKGDHLGISYSAMPPEVPPHRIFSNSRDSETETALAAVEALEDDIGDDIDMRRVDRRRSVSTSRSIYRSRSRSRSRPRSLSASWLSHQPLDFNLTTDVYTRKCSSPEVPGLTPHMDGLSGEEHSEVEGPWSPGDDSFALEGYNDGSTKLRVINLEDTPQPASYVMPSAVTHELKLEKRYVKSKAQLAEEEEELQRRRYSRYGHTFKGISSLRN